MTVKKNIAAAEAVENTAAEAQGETGIQTAQFLVDKKVNALIIVRCGQNAADMLTAVGM